MVKRKRSRESDLEQKLTEARKEIFRALKGAKALERQRYSKRMRDDKSTPDKIKRLEREILVLKSLDLQQTADAHLNSSLLKVKQIAESPALPEQIKQGVPKPELSEEEKAALHNVTSGLFNRVHVREAVDKAVRGVCLALNVPIPDKKKKGKKGADAQEIDRDDQLRDAKKARTEDAKDVSTKKESAKAEEEGENPFDEMNDEVPSDSDEEDAGSDEEPEINQDDEERALEKMEAMLGGSDEEESGDEDMKAKYQALLGEIADGDTADDESNSDESDEEGIEMEDLGDDDDDDDEGMDSDRMRRINAANVSLSPSPPPARKKKEPKSKKAAGKAGETTFLPSLMGGYISNSESEASDLDLAPPKKRLGQKQRQAIWEKKYGSQANHVKNQAQKQKQKGRDNGWDMKKGAVDGEAGSNKPWKRGVSDPLARQGQGRERGGGDQRSQSTFEKRPRPKKDDEGPLHPSWEARKKAKESQTTAAFAGTKITF
ncbi:cellular morphogenesis protein [Colletotrichum truncatum]|uniref:Cellular morphogenesis protein n=1 Tax=Colletotrichum truncatum TaxID=5467 RepID=A0ACC3YQG4_COLTU|nr:cellular morphogenesis protein [Colletotrichum truncatum]KAF6796572.1 cellular morphogenesis protein [Colletotrichum truncatum]